MKRWALLLLVLALPLAGVAYLYGLGGLHIPHTGDEAPYLQITRLTAESGRLLPLQAAEGLDNTKPPLLFWLGIAATSWGRVWDLFLLRLPIVIFSFLTAALAGWTAWRLTRRPAAGFVAALAFLAFWSTFQYGRPFVMNLPVTFFVFLPFAVAVVEPKRLEGWRYWVFAGLSVGVACLFKSFALVVPVAAAFLVFRPNLWKGCAAVGIALLCFLLWPLFDSDPMGILHDFVLKENVGKVGGGSYLKDLVSGAHGIWTTLLGPFFNAGFLAIPLVWLVIDALKRGKKRARTENALWFLLLAFVVVFSLVRHRQANYLLPAMPAIAVLFGLAWERIPRLWLGATAFALMVAALGAFLFQRLMASEVLPPDAWSLWQDVLPVLAFLLAAFAAFRPAVAKRAVLPLVFLVYLCLAAVLAPFEGAPGRFESAAVERVRGQRVWVSSNFRSRYERHRFLLPGADVRGYHRKDETAPPRLLGEGEVVVLRRRLDEPEPEGVTLLGQRLELRTRQTPQEIKELLLERKIDVLVEREMIVSKDGHE